MSLPSLIHMHSGVLEASDPLALELQVVLRHLIRVMGFESRSFARAVCVFLSPEASLQPLGNSSGVSRNPC